MNTRRLSPFLLAAGLLALTGLGGCTTTRPWERGALADETMSPDRNRLSGPMNDHVYFSREASAGGQGVGGGGCGCN